MKLELTEQQIMVIAEALGNAPFNKSAAVIGELQKQINEQRPEGVNGKNSSVDGTS